MQPAIIVVGYKRDKSLSRLLDSISKSSFATPVQIIISLDGGYSELSLKAAENFRHHFSKGSVEIIARTENMGLRDHVICCGDFSEKFGAVIILEDDLIVDPQFYKFASAAAIAYRDDERVGGISLYAQEFNEYVGLPFTPLYNGSSCYFMQIASSWGQLWTAEQWRRFKKWYMTIDESNLYKINNLPSQVKSWSSSSWKKFYSGYLAEQGLYFVYPYQSYTTNVSDGGGTHIIDGTFLLQTNLHLSSRAEDKLLFESIDSANSICYDSYMEPASRFLYDSLGYDQEELTFDLYGSKPLDLLSSYKYSITSKTSDKIIKKIPLSFRPFEQSVMRLDAVSSAHVFLVETKNIKSRKSDNIIELTEYLTGINLKRKDLALPLFASWVQKFSNKIKKLIIKK